MDINFCRRCGEPLSTQGEGYICPNHHSTYPNPKPTVGLVLTKPGSRTVILSRRGIEPRKGELDMFGGFVNTGESFEEAALRELHEETGLSPSNISPLAYLCSAPNNYPFQGEDLDVLSVIFTARVDDTTNMTAADDVAEIVTIDIDSISLDEITANDVRFALEVLQSRKGNL